jgi:hypothetical protein
VVQFVFDSACEVTSNTSLRYRRYVQHVVYRMHFVSEHILARLQFVGVAAHTRPERDTAAHHLLPNASHCSSVRRLLLLLHLRLALCRARCFWPHTYCSSSPSSVAIWGAAQQSLMDSCRLQVHPKAAIKYRGCQILIVDHLVGITRRHLVHDAVNDECRQSEPAHARGKWLCRSR